MLLASEFSDTDRIELVPDLRPLGKDPFDGEAVDLKDAVSTVRGP